MLLLRTFGGLSLENGGRPIVGAAGQPRRLAVLAVLAAAGETGLSRDRLCALFWPDSDEERARGALKQALYAMRRDVQEQDLTAGSNELRLNAAVITSDVAAFNTALATGDLAAAASQYTGQFLDGVHLRGESEFERWADEHRRALATKYANALEALTVQAMDRHDIAAGVDWARRLNAADALNTRAALLLMNALAAAGDRAGAIVQGDLHARLLKQELEVEPDAEFTQVLRRLRETPASGPPAGRVQPGSAALVPDLPPSTAPVAVDAVVVPPVERPGVTPRWWRRPAAFAGFALVAAIIYAAFTFRPASSGVPAESKAPAPAISVPGLCADGSAPPCTVAPSAVPQLDDHAWIVVPFDNPTRAPDADSLRYTAASLLSFEFSRWTDIHGTDIERVPDLIAEVVPPLGTQPMSLNEGLAVARRAKAGRLVMGGVYKTGNRTTFVAKVFDVNTGEGIRIARDSAATRDSVVGLFPHLAQVVLNLPRPAGAMLGATIGTNKLDAVQEYVEGVMALNSVHLADAARHLGAAIKADSTFALAHYKLARLAEWTGLPDSVHTLEAQRFSAGLPARERGLIAGQVALSTRDFPGCNATFGSLVRADSSDVDALFGLAECSYHDNVLEQLPADTTQFRFRGSWNVAARGFERVIALDPTYHLAYLHMLDMRVGGEPSPEGSTRHGVRLLEGGKTLPGHFALMRVDADTLLLIATRWGRLTREGLAARQAVSDVYWRTRSQARNLEIALRTARQWARADSAESSARLWVAHLLLMLDSVNAADRAMRHAVRGKASELAVQKYQQRTLNDRLEIAFKLGRVQEVLRLRDSVTGPIQLAAYAALGRVREFDSLRSGGASSTPDDVARFRAEPAHTFRLLCERAVLGVAGDSLDKAERTLLAPAGAGAPNARANPAFEMPIWSLKFGLRAPRTSWPEFMVTPEPPPAFDPWLEPGRALARHDTAALRGASRRVDSLTRVAATTTLVYGHGWDGGMLVIVAETHALLGDSAVALRQVAQYVDSVTVRARFSALWSMWPDQATLWPRAMLLRADLAAGMGRRAEARTWYRRFIEMWVTADPELQPTVTRAKKALAALGG